MRVFLEEVRIRTGGPSTAGGSPRGGCASFDLPRAHTNHKGSRRVRLSMLCLSWGVLLLQPLDAVTPSSPAFRLRPGRKPSMPDSQAFTLKLNYYTTSLSVSYTCRWLPVGFPSLHNCTTNSYNQSPRIAIYLYIHIYVHVYLLRVPFCWRTLTNTSTQVAFEGLASHSLCVIFTELSIIMSCINPLHKALVRLETNCKDFKF